MITYLKEYFYEKIHFFFNFSICGDFHLFCPIYASAYTLPAGTEVEAQSATLYNVETDTVVYEKDADKQMEPASTTKLMTALIVSEHVTNFDLPRPPIQRWKAILPDSAHRSLTSRRASRFLPATCSMPCSFPRPATRQTCLRFTSREAPKNSSSL